MTDLSLEATQERVGRDLDHPTRRALGVVECERRGWYARGTAGGWEPCSRAESDIADLNRLAYFLATGQDFYGDGIGPLNSSGPSGQTGSE